jgi:simple sugar transport system permease protein
MDPMAAQIKKFFPTIQPYKDLPPCQICPHIWRSAWYYRRFLAMDHFIVSSPDTFLSSRIYFAFMSTIPFFAIMAIPLTMVVIAGEMDLSFPSIMGMGMVAFSFVYERTVSIDNVTTRVILAFIAALVSGSLIGWLNGVIIVKFGIPSLVATIGTQFFWRGAVLVLTEGRNYTLSYIRKLLYQCWSVIAGYFPMQMIWLIVIAIFG